MSKKKKQAKSETVRQRVEGPLLYRDMQLRASIIDEEKREIEFSFSSEEPVLRSSFFDDPWLETLGHDPAEVDMSRINAGAAPLLYNHGRDSDDPARLGRLTKGWIADGKAYARAIVSKRDEVKGLWADVRDEILVNTSVGYQIEERTLTREVNDGPDEYRVTRWVPMEVSLVDMPADPTVGLGRDVGKNETLYRVFDIDSARAEMTEVSVMAKAKENAPDGGERQGAKEDEKVTVTDAAGNTLGVGNTPRELEDSSGVRELATQAERERIKNLHGLFSRFGGTYTELRDECVLNGTSVAKAQQRLLDALGQDQEPANPRIELINDEHDKTRDGVQLAIMVRAQMGTPEDVRNNYSNEFRSYTLLEIARHCLRMNGLTVSGDKMAIVGRALHSSSDFQAVLANTANKALLMGFDQAPETWRTWCQTGNLSDFKISDRSGLGLFSDLDLMPENAEYKYGTIGEGREQIQLATYGKIFAIGRQAIINDDLSAFNRTPFKLGQSAARVPGDLAYAILTSNPNMRDGVALFHANHSNLSPGGAAAITAASVGSMRTAMGTQTDPNARTNDETATSRTLNIRFGYLIVPMALQDTALVLMASERDPAATTPEVPNPVRGAATVVADSRLDADSASAWYGAARDADTVEVAFLDGAETPTLEERDGWNVDGVEFKVRLDCAAKALEWATLSKNAGP